MNSADKRIEELLNRAGQTISDLPKDYSDEMCMRAYACAQLWRSENELSTWHECLKYILHLTDVIDRFETALENVCGERDYLRKIMQRFQFGLAECVEEGEAKGHTFRAGDIYPILGLNNGIQICFEGENESGGDAEVLMCHTFDCFAPIEGEKFVYQDGTIPPLFKPMSNMPDGVPDDWSVDDEKGL